MNADENALPRFCRVGSGVRLHVKHLSVGEDVELGDDVTIVGDQVDLGSGTRIGRGTDLRAAEITIGRQSEIGADVSVLVAETFDIGGAARMADGCRILARSFRAGRLLYVGYGTTVGFGGTTTSTAHVRIGDRVTIGQFAILNANYPLTIGDGVGTGSYLAIWTHGYHFGHGPLNGSRPTYAPVTVGNNVWLGFQVTILPGATIGDDTMIAAGAVVSGVIPPRVLAGGVPAKVKKSIDVSPVDDEVALAAVLEVMRVWRDELRWKGCRVDTVLETEDRLTLRVTAPDAADEVVVHVCPEATRDELAASPEPFVVLDVSGERPDTDPPDHGTVFDLRARGIRGRRSALVEDLRDQLRRYAMPCGDDACFRAIEPEAFRVLRDALPAVAEQQS
jgi:acetyltransferase-like isoleucine patch superfamily enzyme